MSYDCNRIFDYSHEIVRMCETYRKAERKDDSSAYTSVCNDCPITTGELFCSASIFKITPEKIAIVQQWSDEHPEKSRREAFYEIFPLARNVDDLDCFKHLIGEFCDLTVSTHDDCVKCWNEPYAGEFEAAREAMRKEHD